MADESSDKAVAPKPKRSNAAAAKPEHVAEPVEMEWNDTPIFGCPFCGANGEDRDRIQQHIDTCQAGGER